MKTLFLSLLLLISAAASAVDRSPYTFDFIDSPDGKVLLADISKMALIGEAVKWELAAHSENLDDNKDIKLLHSVTLFKKPQQTDVNQIQFQKIYTYGYIICSRKELNILNEWYTTQEDAIRLLNRFQAGEYVVDLTANEILQRLELLACRVEDI